jgi:hypothetical protein
MGKRLVLISGVSGTGKSTSLRTIKDPSGVIYLNADNGKELPFPSKFEDLTILEPETIYDALEQSEELDYVHTIVVDTISFLMNLVESTYVIDAPDTFKGWSEYAQFFKTLMQKYVAESSKNIIMLAHTQAIRNAENRTVENKVPIKGSLKEQGIESYFTTVVSTKILPVSKLTKYENPHLNITEEEELTGYKHVFQTRLTKDTINERIRAGIGMWSVEETYIDNDAQVLIDRLNKYYK